MFTAYFLGGPWHARTHVLTSPIDPFRVAAPERVRWENVVSATEVAIRTEFYRLEKVRLFGRNLRLYVHESVPPCSPALDRLAFDAFVSPLARGLIESQEAGR